MQLCSQAVEIEHRTRVLRKTVARESLLYMRMTLRMTRAVKEESGGGLVINTLQPGDCIVSMHDELLLRRSRQTFREFVSQPCF